MIAALLSSTVLLAAPDVASAAPRNELNLAVLTGSPASPLPGISVGVSAEARRTWRGPFFGSLRLGWAEESEANVNWMVTHHQLQAALGVGVQRALGAGRFWAQAGGGVGGVYEVLSRHQIDRIQTAGVPGGEESSYSLGPHAFAELGLAVQVHEAVSGFLAFGPWLFRTEVNGAAQTRTGAFARLGVAFDF